jgi:hypothetical protein
MYCANLVGFMGECLPRGPQDFLTLLIPNACPWNRFWAHTSQLSAQCLACVMHLIQLTQPAPAPRFSL